MNIQGPTRADTFQASSQYYSSRVGPGIGLSFHKNFAPFTLSSNSQLDYGANGIAGFSKWATEDPSSGGGEDGRNSSSHTAGNYFGPSFSVPQTTHSGAANIASDNTNSNSQPKVTHQKAAPVTGSQTFIESKSGSSGKADTPDRDLPSKQGTSKEEGQAQYSIQNHSQHFQPAHRESVSNEFSTPQHPSYHFRGHSPKESLRYSTTTQMRERQVSQVVHPPVTTSEVIIEHPPILKGIIERPSVMYTNYHPVQTAQTVRYGVGGMVSQTVASLPEASTSVYSTTVKELVYSKRDSSIERKSILADEANSLQRLRERNEELLMLLQRGEGQDKETILQLKRSLEGFHNRVSELEERYRRAAHERDDLTYKLENRADTNTHLRDKVAELEVENKILRLKALRFEGDHSVLMAEKAELEVQVRKLNAELSSKLFSQDYLASEANNRLRITEEKNRHLEKRLLDMEDDISRIGRDYKEYRDKSSLLHLQQNERTVTKVIHASGPSESDSAVSTTLYAQIKEKNLIIEDLKNKIDSLDSKLRTSEKNHNEAFSLHENEKIKHQNTQSLRESEKKSFSAKIDDLNRKIEDILTSIRQEKDLSSSLSKEIDNLKSRLRVSEEELETARRERTSLTNDKKSLETKIHSLELDLAKIQRFFDAKSADVVQLESELGVKNSKLSQAQRTIADLEKEITELKHLNKTLEGANSRLDKESELKNSNDMVKDLNQDVETLQDALRSLEDQAISREEELITELEAARNTIDELEAKIEALTEQLEETEERLQFSISEQDKIRAFSEKLICDNSTLQKRVEMLLSELAGLQDRLQDQNHYADEQALRQQTVGNQQAQDSELNKKVAYQLRRLIDLVELL